MRDSVTKMGNFLSFLCRRLDNPMAMMKKLWETYALPAVLYGAEIVSFSKTIINELETKQRAFIRLALKLPMYTPNIALYRTTQIHMIEHYIMEKKLQFWRYVSSQSHPSWVACAWREQQQAAVSVGWCSTTGAVLSPPNNSQIWWIRDILVYMERAHISPQQTWSKLDISLLCERFSSDTEIAETRLRSTLQYTDFAPWMDKEYSYRRQKWWIKARLGGLALNHRICREDTRCTICELDEPEDIVHFLVTCPRLSHSPWFLESILGDTDKQKCEHCLSFWRTPMERKSLAVEIEKRWSERESLKLIKNGDPPPAIDHKYGQDTILYYDAIICTYCDI